MIYANGTGIIKAATYDADHSPPTSAKVMNAWSITFCLDIHMQYHPPTHPQSLTAATETYSHPLQLSPPARQP